MAGAPPAWRRRGRGGKGGLGSEGTRQQLKPTDANQISAAGGCFWARDGEERSQASLWPGLSPPPRDCIQQHSWPQAAFGKLFVRATRGHFSSCLHPPAAAQPPSPLQPCGDVFQRLEDSYQAIPGRISSNFLNCYFFPSFIYTDFSESIAMAPCKRGSEKPNAVISDILAKYFQSHSPMYKKLQNLLFQMRFRSIFFSL